jgi:hypothetical protein
MRLWMQAFDGASAQLRSTSSLSKIRESLLASISISVRPAPRQNNDFNGQEGKQPRSVLLGSGQAMPPAVH